MGFADALDTELKKGSRRLCQMGALLESLADADREAFQNAKQQIATHRLHTTVSNQYSPLTANAVWRALKSEGHIVSRDAVQKHIGDTCICKPL